MSDSTGAARAGNRPCQALVNAAGSTSGGGRTWVVAMLEELEERGGRGVAWEFLVERSVAAWFRGRQRDDLRVREVPVASTIGRSLWEQTILPGRARHFDVLVNAANFAPLVGASRNILLAQNALHFEKIAVKGRRRRRYQVETALARASVRRSRLTMTATRTMADMVQSQTGRRPVTNPFGPGLVQGTTPPEDGRLRFAHRTGWGPHKRFGDVLLAVRDVARTHRGGFVVNSACDPRTDFARGFTESEVERQLLADPLIQEHVQVASFPAEEGRLVDGDVVLMPSTTESFCFPLAEGLAHGLPVIAAESGFARELCGPGAFYVTPGNPAALAAGMRRLLGGHRPPPPPREFVERLSWARHADRLAELCHAAASASASKYRPPRGERSRRGWQ